MNHHDTDEARAKQRQRRAMQKAQGIDALAERMRLVSFWKKCAEKNPAYGIGGAWWRPFIVQPGFRRLCMPTLRAKLDARDKAWKQQCAEEARAYDLKCAAAKVQRLAATRAKQPAPGQTMDLFS